MTDKIIVLVRDVLNPGAITNISKYKINRFIINNLFLIDYWYFFHKESYNICRWQRIESILIDDHIIYTLLKLNINCIISIS